MGEILLTILFILLILAVIYIALVAGTVPSFLSWFKKLIIDIFIYIGEKLRAHGLRKGTGFHEFDKALKAAGYIYDPKQDIFYSAMNAWQRNFGYCHLYDESCAPMGMILDCEPITFEYNGKRWLIEFWKGQYDLTTGCEVGVYNTQYPDLDILNIFTGPFFFCASNKDRLYISYALKKHSKTLFKRSGKHWWLTGFKLGVFSEPSELVMHIKIVMKDAGMLNAFVKALNSAGYRYDEIGISGMTVSVTFDKPHSKQPISRTPDTDWIIQRKNEKMCEAFQYLSKGCRTAYTKVKEIKDNDAQLYDELLNPGKARELFGLFDLVKNFVK